MKCKKIFDGRQLPRKAKEQLRVAAVKRVEAGESPEFVAAGLGINRRTIYRWIEAFHYGGESALESEAHSGRTAKLDAKQMARLARIVYTKNPLQLNFEFALWTLAMIRVLIRREFAVSLSEVSVGRLMRRLGFSPQRPLYRAWQQDPALVERWRAEAYPKIAARAKREGALIFFADESGIRSDHHAGTTWAPVGQTPVVKATRSKRYGLNLLSAVNALGHFRFMTVEGRVNASVFREFLEAGRLPGWTARSFSSSMSTSGAQGETGQALRRTRNAAAIELFFSSCHPTLRSLTPTNWPGLISRTRIAKATTPDRGRLEGDGRACDAPAAEDARNRCRLLFMPLLVPMPRCEALLTQGLVHALDAEICQLREGIPATPMKNLVRTNDDASIVDGVIRKCEVLLEERRLALLTRAVAAQMLACLPAQQEAARMRVAHVLRDHADDFLSDLREALLKLINDKIKSRWIFCANARLDRERLTKRVEQFRKASSTGRQQLRRGLDELGATIESQIHAQSGRGLLLAAKLDESRRITKLYRIDEPQTTATAAR